MDYGCDISNRYTGYLDSSDHGNPMGASTGKNKRKTKKKRKQKQHKLIDKCINTEENMIELNSVDDNQQSSKDDSKCDINYKNDEKNDDTNSLANANDYAKIPCSYGSPDESELSKDDTKDNSEHTHCNADDGDSEHSTEYTIEKVNNNETKWSVICFEEEKTLLAMESSTCDGNESQFNDDGTQKSFNDPEMMFNEHRVYPTVYFYNSNFGNKNRRSVDWFDSGRQSRNDNELIRNDNGKKMKHRNNGKYRKKLATNEKDAGDAGDTRSDDSKTIDSHNESNEQSTAQSNKQSMHREYTNSKNRYNKFQDGMPQRTFSRRRSDFVRNV